MSETETRAQDETPTPTGRLKAFVRPVMVGLALVFVGFSAWDLAHRWESQELTVSVGWCAAALVPVLLAGLVQYLAWRLLIERMVGRSVPRRAAARCYLESQIARYTPGKVGLPVVRMAGASVLGVPARTVGASILIEMLSWTAVGALVGLGLLTGFARELEGAWVQGVPIVLGAACVGLTAVLLLDRARYPSFLVRIIEGPGATADTAVRGPYLPWSVPLAHLFHWGLWAVHGLLVVRALGGSWTEAAGACGFFPLAPVAGFLALAAPAGVGVREAVISMGISPALGVQSALVAAVLSRAASLATDVGLWIGARARDGKRAEVH